MNGALQAAIPLIFVLCHINKIRYMHKILLCGLLLATQAVHAQYWQQEVNYKIDVRLDDKNHVLRAFEAFEYINHSPDQLDFIYIHLWPNAYRDGNTALGKQQYNGGEDQLRYGGPTMRGHIDSLDFKVNGQSAKWELDPENPDICKLFLSQPLNAGGRIQVSTPFRVQLPSGKVSRMGHIDQSYQITQWYPKPAVYDKNGWNQIPYLNQGEFYSEYGAFDVSITLPKNYVVGATGDLQTASEKEFLDQLAAQTAAEIETKIIPEEEKSAFPASSDAWKTIRYTQSKVHDFAWFADKRFLVLKGEVTMPASGRKVISWAMFTPKNANLWKKSIEYINDGTYYYSKWNGEYPYNQVTAVDGTISAGGGMEYPNVTVIGNSSNAMELEIVIVHEVGHNWFYGILGSNERVHGWMDEGMNTLNEMRYMQTKYPNNTNMSDAIMGTKFHLGELDHHDMGDMTYRVTAMLGEDQPIETHSAKFTNINYGGIMYMKTGLVFLYLKDYLGEEKFTAAMHAYFETWKFRHPQPEDIRAALENASGKKLDWLFEDLIQTTNHIDYKLKNVKTGPTGTQAKIKNIGQVAGPIGVTAFVDGKPVETVWVEPGSKKSTVQFKSNADAVQIDVNGNIPELDRSNNNWNKDWLFKKVEPLKFEFFTGDHERDRSNNFWSPFAAANSNDKFMLGIAVHNYAISLKKFQYLMIPMYSFGRQNISGMGEFSFTFLPKSQIKLTRLGVSVKSFKHDDKRDDNSYFAAIAPYLYVKLGNRRNASPVVQTLLLQTIYRYDQYGTSAEQAGAYLQYTFDFNSPDHRFSAIVRTDYMDNIRNDDEVTRSTVEATYSFRYLRNKMKRWIEIRGFAGNNWSYRMSDISNNTYTMSLGGASGAQDFFLEQYFFDRTRFMDNASTQRMENMGGFKTTSSYGTTAGWMTSGNLYFQLPIKAGIFGIFADAGLFDSPYMTPKAVLNTGIGVRLGKILGLYFPVWMSPEMKKAYTNTSYGEKIRFTLKLNLINKPLSLSTFM
jgi:hypothetical protein